MDVDTGGSVSARLRKAKKAVRDATAEALKAASSNETLPGVSVRESQTKFGTISAASHGNAENADPNYPDDDETEAAARRASFELGMTLFGGNVSEIEREISEKLEAVEKELRDIVTSVETGTSDAHVDNDDDLDGLDEGAVDREARELSIKVRFLKSCGEARALLDECAAPSASSGEGLVKLAGKVSRADAALANAADELDSASSDAEGREENESVVSGNRDIDVARRILDSLRSTARRKRVELHSRASATLDACISMTTTNISVRTASLSAGGSNGGSRHVNGSRVDSLEDVYNALELLSSDEQEGVASRGNKLEDAMRLLSDNLYSVVFNPVLSMYKESISMGKDTSLSAALWQSQMSVSAEPIGPSTGGILRGTLSTTAKGSVVTLEWKRRSPDGKGIREETLSTDKVESYAVAWSEMMVFIRDVLSFVRESVLCNRAFLCRMVGKFLFGDPLRKEAAEPSGISLGKIMGGAFEDDERHGPLTKQMLKIAKETCIPSSSSYDVLSSLAGISKILQQSADAFERDLIKKDFLPSTLNSKSSTSLPLSKFASSVEQKYAEKRRTKILSDGRDLLMNTDYHNTVEVGVDVDKLDGGGALDSAVFKLHKSAISQVASNLMALCRKTMNEAVDPKCTLDLLPATLYRTCRELLDLFRAVIPVAHGSEVSTIPRTAAILHNDAVFFAHNLLFFGLEYKDKFPIIKSDDAEAGGKTRGETLRQMCTFVDLVTPFREMAERVMGDMVERQKSQLVEIVGSRITILRDALRSNESVLEWTEAETALSAGLYHLRHLSQTWKPVLSNAVYNRAVGNLVDTLIALYLDQIMKAPDISELATHFVSALLSDARRGFSELFDASSVGEGIKIAKESSSLWDRFVAVGGFMDMSLADINTALAEGVFRSVTGPELSRLIVATFDESEKRTKLLHALASD